MGRPKKVFECPFCNGHMEYENSLRTVLVCFDCGESILRKEYGLSLEEIDEHRATPGYYVIWPREKEVKIPEGFRACGGPYPQCMTSCKLYDN